MSCAHWSVFPVGSGSPSREPFDEAFNSNQLNHGFRDQRSRHEMLRDAYQGLTALAPTDHVARINLAAAAFMVV